MSFTKTEIYNLALSALLLSEEVINIDSSKSNNISILNRFWNVAFQSTLQDLDLDSLSEPIPLELIEELDDTYSYDFVYKYPSNCLFFRRIQSGFLTDNRSTHISKRVGLYEGQKAIFTNESTPTAECIPKDVPIEAFNAMAVLAVGYKLAILSAPLLVGKGAKRLREEINNSYIIAKFEAQETDARENFRYESEEVRSEFVEARLS